MIERDESSLRECLRYFAKRPWRLLAEILGLIAFFGIGYVLLILGMAYGLR